MTKNDGCRADVRKARAEAAEVEASLIVDDAARVTGMSNADPTAAAVRAAQAEALREAADEWEQEDTDAVGDWLRDRADRLATDTAAPVGGSDLIDCGCPDGRYDLHVEGGCRWTNAAPEGDDWECGDPYSGIGCPVLGCTHDPKGWPESATMHPAAPDVAMNESSVHTAAPVAVEGVETVETLAEYLCRRDHPSRWEFSRQTLTTCDDCTDVAATVEASPWLAARIVQARAGEGALREACERAWDEGATAAWYDCQIGSDDSRDACEMRVDNPYALTTADPS